MTYTTTLQETQGHFQHVATVDGFDGFTRANRLSYVLNPTSLTVEPLDSEVLRAFPHACSHVPGRAVGSVDACFPPDNVSHLPVVLNIHVAESVKVHSHRRTTPMHRGENQLRIARLQQLRECLAQCAHIVSPGDTVAIPWSAGCTSWEEWTAWRSELRSFAQIARVQVTVVQKSADAVTQSIKRAKAAVLRQTAEAKRTSFTDADSNTARIGHLLIDALSKHCLDTIPDNRYVRQPPSLGQTMTATLSAEADHVRKEKDTLLANNQAITDELHATVKDDFNGGVTSIRDIRDSQSTVAGCFHAATAFRSGLRREVKLTGLRTEGYNGLTGHTDGIAGRGGRIRVYLDNPPGGPFVNVMQAHAVDRTSADAFEQAASL